MNSLTFLLDLVTPMYLKADDPSNIGQPVLRAAPFRGEIRYWLRALIGASSVPDLKQAEANVFGSTKAGSVIRLWVKPEQNLTVKERPMLPHRLSSSKSPLPSKGFVEDEKIQLGLCGRPGLLISDQTLLSFLLWLNLGGVGKRARRGFGSLQCSTVSKNMAIISPEVADLLNPAELVNGDNLTDQIHSLLARLPGLSAPTRTLPPPVDFGIAPYPSFQPKTWAVVVGKNFFANYTEAMRDFWGRLRSPRHIDRVAYGSDDPRHASPIHVHVAKTKKGYHLVLTAFFSEPENLLNKERIRNLLQECCTAYGGTAFFQ